MSQTPDLASLEKIKYAYTMKNDNIIDVHTIINRSANLYFFVSNLSEWHKSCRKKYNQEWIKNKELSSTEKLSLIKFAKIHNKYSFSNDSYYLGRAFYLNQNPWSEIKKNTTCEKELREIMNVFDSRFEKIWEKAKTNLVKHQNFIDKYFSTNNQVIKKIYKDLSFFFCLDKPKVNNVEIVLLLSAKDFIGGGANIKPYGITLEVSGWKKDNNKILSVIFHELTHLAFENYVMLPEELTPVDSKIREAIIAGLFPNGYLSEKYFSIKNTNYVGEFIKDYFSQAKCLDSELILKIKETS